LWYNKFVKIINIIMILDRIQRYLGIVFLITLVFTQALIFVAVSASGGDDLPVVFLEPVSESVNIGDSLYFQAMIDQTDDQYDLVYFNLKNLNTGLDENYQASLQDDGAWSSQSLWDTTGGYQPDVYYLSLVAHRSEDIYYSQDQVIYLNGDFEAAAVSDGVPYFSYPENGQNINPETTLVLTPQLHVNSEDSDAITAMRFSLIREGDGGFQTINFPDHAEIVGSDALGFDIWEASLSLDTTITHGEYTIMVTSNDEGGTSMPLITDAMLFTIGTSFDSPIDPPPGGELSTEITILSPDPAQDPAQVFSMDENMTLKVSSEVPLNEHYVIYADIDHLDGAGTIAREILYPTVNEPSVYTTLIDFDEYIIGEEDDEGGAPLEGIFFIGDYSVLFYLSSRNDDGADVITAGRVRFSLETAAAEPVYELRRNNYDNNPIVGDLLELDFETTFSADGFNFSVVKENDSTMAVESFVDRVGDGTIWQSSISAAENGFTNGTYILVADAWIIDGVSVEHGPYAFEWIVNEEEEPLPLEDVSLVAHQPSGGQFGPGNVLIGSANILDIEFILRSVGDTTLGHTLEYTSVDCNSGAIISQEIRDNIVLFGHNYCFYSSISGDIADEIINGNYNFFLQHLGTDFTVYSDSALVTYFNEAQQDDLPEDPIMPEDVIFRVHKLDSEEEQIIFISSNWEHALVDLGNTFSVIFDDKNSESQHIEIVRPLDNLSAEQITPWLPFIEEIQINNTDTPYVFVAPHFADDLPVLNGEYTVYAEYNNDNGSVNIESENRLDIIVAGNFEDIPDEDIIFDLYEPLLREVDGRSVLSFPLLTNSVTTMLPSLFTINDDEIYNFEFFTDIVEWEELTGFDIPEDIDRQDISTKVIFNVYLENAEGQILLEDGDYYYQVGERFTSLESTMYFSIQNGTLIIDTEQDDQDEDSSSGSGSENTDVVIDFYSTCVEQGITDQDICMWFRATMDLLDPTCIEQGIYEALACEDYLFRIETDMECQDNDIIERESCKNYLLEKYGGQVDCQLDDMNLCNSILRNEYLNRLVSGQRLSDNINQAVDSLLGQNVSTQHLSNTLEGSGIDSLDVLPLTPNEETKVLIARAQKETVLEEKDKLTILNQAVIIFDTDGDGLSDDLEEYYGTEKDNPDTDGDGYSDGEEINNNYDPRGPGKLIKDRTAFDIVTLDENKVIEQPKIKSKKIDKKMEVEAVEALEEEVKLSGRAEANTWVNLYLYSGLPLVMTTKTDASGNWSYDIKHSLTDGHHRVFVTVNDDTGKIVKQSRPISFLIKEAQAVTADDYFDETSSSGAVNNLFIYYILGGAFLVFLALGAIVYLHKGKNQNLEV
jgi:hypothetical protein